MTKRSGRFLGMGFRSTIGVAIGLTVAGMSVAAAQDDAYLLQETPIVDELRVGLAFHDVYGGFLPTNPDYWDFSQLEDVAFDVLFTSPDFDAFRWIGSPRPNLGGTINFDGQESMLHLGLTWQLPLFDTPVYLEGTLGAALNNGYLTNPPPGFQAMGCNLGFYEQFGLGAHLTEKLTATLTYEHTSNWELCEANAGLSTLGIRLGWKF